MIGHPLASSPKSVALAGDWHGDLGHAKSVIGWAAREGANGVVQLGDFGFWHGAAGKAYLDGVAAALDEAGIWLVFIDGNHENFERLNALPLDDLGARPVRDHLWHLPRGLRWRWHGRTWLALGGATSLDRPGRSLGVSWWPEEEITGREVMFTVLDGEADVMLTHDCPEGVDIPGLPPESWWPREELARANRHRAQLRQVVDAVQPKELWHGHFHSEYTATLRGEFAGKAYECTVRGLDDNTGPFPKNVHLLSLETS